MSEIISIISIILTFILGVLVAIMQARSKKYETDAAHSAPDSIAEGAQILIKLSRAEWERERSKRIQLEVEIKELKIMLEECKKAQGEIEQMKIRIFTLEADRNEAYKTAVVLYKQLQDNDIEPMACPEEDKKE